MSSRKLNPRFAPWLSLPLFLLAASCGARSIGDVVVREEAELNRYANGLMAKAADAEGWRVDSPVSLKTDIDVKRVEYNKSGVAIEAAGFHDSPVVSYVYSHGGTFARAYEDRITRNGFYL